MDVLQPISLNVLDSIEMLGDPGKITLRQLRRDVSNRLRIPYKPVREDQKQNAANQHQSGKLRRYPKGKSDLDGGK